MTCPICLINKGTNITIDSTKALTGFHDSNVFSLLNVEIMRWFTSDFVSIWSTTSYPFYFISRIKRPTHDILKLFVTTLSNQYKKVYFISKGVYEALARYFEFMWTCHNTNIIFQKTDGDAYSLNIKSKIPNKTLNNITRELLMKSSHNEALWCLSYNYAIWV